jgi:hypothetical protein
MPGPRLFLVLALPIVAALGAARAAAQQAIRVEPPDGVTAGLAEPFSERHPITWYQQVYDASLFSGPVEIRSLTFFPAFATTRISSGTYRLALSTTSRPVDDLGTNRIANRGADHRVAFEAVLGGPVTAPLVLSIAPFGYDPAVGNLLVEIDYVFGTTNGFGGFLAGRGNFAGLSSRAFWPSPTSAPRLDPGFGLVTELDVAPVACADGLDNDGDGAIDHPSDDGCEHPADRSESPGCSDRFDNDDDGLVDFPDDAGCDGPDDPTELPPTVCGWEGEPVVLGAGDLLVAGFAGPPGETDAGLYRVDASTGDRTLVSGLGRGEGPDLVYPFGIVVESPRSIFVSDNGANRIVRVDPWDGSRELVSGDGRGAGPALEQPTDMFRLPSGDLAVIAYPASSQVLRVDPITGDRDAIVPRGTMAPLSLVPYLIDVAPDGRVWLWDGHSWLAWRLDLGTGEVLTSLDLFDWENGWPLGTVNGTVVEANGTLLVSDGSLVEIDPVSGLRTLVSGSSRGSGPAAGFLHLDAEASGALVAPGKQDDILRIDRVSGDRFLVSSAQRGCGPLASFQWIAVVRGTDLSPDCGDGLDNDRDGLVDGFDPGCDDANDPSERAAGLACDDGRDDDGHLDGWDHPDDPGCAHPGEATEAPECQDGHDNDSTPGTDFDGGASVRGPAGADPAGADPQCAGRPWWRSEAGGRGCGLGFEAIAALVVLLRLRGRRPPAAQS